MNSATAMSSGDRAGSKTSRANSEMKQMPRMAMVRAAMVRIFRMNQGCHGFCSGVLTGIKPPGGRC